MRCIICDRSLSDYEATLKDKYTGEFKDTCHRCLGTGGRELTPHEELKEIDRFSQLLSELDEKNNDNKC